MPPRTAALTYPIRAVAQMTGLSIDTLRAWERRYEAVTPERSDRGRVYRDSDVARLRQLAELVGRGHAIGTIARLPAADLQRLLDQQDVSSAAVPPPATTDLSGLFRSVEHYDLRAIEAALSRYAAVLTPEDLVFAVILPLMAEIGRRWENKKLRPSHEHLVSAIVRSALGGLLRSIGSPHATTRVVFATLSGERHELGLLSASVLAASAGIGVIFLGPDLPVADVVHAAKTSRAHAVVLAATAGDGMAVDDVRSLVKALPGTPIGIGGPAAQPLVRAAGGTCRHLQALGDVAPMVSGRKGRGRA
jgi:DNA-binding transcriptional MerR regulator